MSNLIPTPRTDKNGRVVLRHMNPETAPSYLRASLPTVGALSRRVSDRESLHEYFMSKWKSFDGGELSKALKLLQEDSEETIPLLYKYLTAGGSGSTHAYIEGHIGASIMEVINASNRSSYDPKWRDKCKDILSPKFRGETSRLWHALTVSDESGYEWDDVEEHANWIKNTQILVESNWSDVDLPKSDAHWRGMSALALVQLHTKNEVFYTHKDLIKQVPGFVELAGTHGDLRQVMDIAVPRYLIDADAIRDIMDQQSGAPAIGSGVL